MNKKFTVILLLSCFCMSMTACGSAENVSSDSGNNSGSDSISEEEWLTEVSNTAIDNLSELTYDDNYIKAYINSQEIVDIVKEWQGEEVKKDEVYVIRISEDDTKSFMEFSGEFDYNSFSDTAKNLLCTKIVNAVPNYIAGREGTNYVVIGSILNYSVSYAVDYDIDNQIWFMPTDKDGLAVCVSFSNSGENVVSVSSSYLYYGEEESLKDLLDTYVPYLKAELQN